jgi:hypothetical protein
MNKELRSCFVRSGFTPCFVKSGSIQKYSFASALAYQFFDLVYNFGCLFCVSLITIICFGINRLKVEIALAVKLNMERSASSDAFIVSSNILNIAVSNNETVISSRKHYPPISDFQPPYAIKSIRIGGTPNCTTLLGLVKSSIARSGNLNPKAASALRMR